MGVPTIGELTELAAQAPGEGPRTALYAALLIAGFLVGAWGHASRSRWAVALGIGIVILAVVLFQLEIKETSVQDLPPGV